jgi:hypothetical protein
MKIQNKNSVASYFIFWGQTASGVVEALYASKSLKQETNNNLRKIAGTDEMHFSFWDVALQHNLLFYSSE